MGFHSNTNVSKSKCRCYVQRCKQEKWNSLCVSHKLWSNQAVAHTQTHKERCRRLAPMPSVTRCANKSTAISFTWIIYRFVRWRVFYRDSAPALLWLYGVNWIAIKRMLGCLEDAENSTTVDGYSCRWYWYYLEIFINILLHVVIHAVINAELRWRVQLSTSIHACNDTHCEALRHAHVLSTHTWTHSHSQRLHADNEHR